MDKKIDARKEILATKEDILQLRVDMGKRFNQNIIWMVSTGIAIVGLLLTFLKI